jgi:integrase
MKSAEVKSSSTNTTKSAVRVQSHGTKSAARFQKVKDGRGQDIRGLWVRNDRYYAQLQIESPLTGEKKVKRVPLKDTDGNPVPTAAQAKDAMERLRVQRVDNTLPVLARTPKFIAYAVQYVENIVGAKAAGTVEKEKTILDRWAEKVGQLRLDQVKRVHVNRFIDARLKDGAAARTINLDVIGLRNMMKRALQDGIIQRLPTEGLKPLRTTTEKRPLFTSGELEKLCQGAFGTKQNPKGKEVPLTENAQQFADYMRLMAYSGTRRNEALGLQWDDIDFDQRQLHVRRQVTQRKLNPVQDLKGKEQRTVDFNPKLEQLLKDMDARRAPDCKWVFPSPQRGEKDIPAKSFKESLTLAKERAKLPRIGFHDCRHHFISMCVMSGIDFMTIAAWVGHKDGGVLIGKVYGHLANEHRRRMADRLTFLS